MSFHRLQPRAGSRMCLQSGYLTAWWRPSRETEYGSELGPTKICAIPEAKEPETSTKQRTHTLQPPGNFIQHLLQTGGRRKHAVNTTGTRNVKCVCLQTPILSLLLALF